MFSYLITKANIEHTKDTRKQKCCDTYQIKINPCRDLMVCAGGINCARMILVGYLWGLPLTK